MNATVQRQAHGWTMDLEPIATPCGTLRGIPSRSHLLRMARLQTDRRFVPRHESQVCIKVLAKHRRKCTGPAEFQFADRYLLQNKNEEESCPAGTGPLRRGRRLFFFLSHALLTCSGSNERRRPGRCRDHYPRPNGRARKDPFTRVYTPRSAPTRSGPLRQDELLYRLR